MRIFSYQLFFMVPFLTIHATFWLMISYLYLVELFNRILRNLYKSNKRLSDLTAIQHKQPKYRHHLWHDTASEFTTTKYYRRNRKNPTPNINEYFDYQQVSFATKNEFPITFGIPRTENVHQQPTFFFSTFVIHLPKCMQRIYMKKRRPRELALHKPYT